MRSSTILAPTLCLLTTLIQPIASLEALSNSPCAQFCGNVLGSTQGSDIVCPDSGYGSLTGTTYSSCVECQLKSDYVDPSTNETDLQWGLYNLRWAVSWCLFGYPNNTDIGDSPCVTSRACGTIEEGFTYQNLSDNVPEYGYCDALDSGIIPECQNCLRVETEQYYIYNFVTLLNGACDQRLAAGATLSFKGSPFSTTQLNMTTATPSSVAGKAYPGLSLGGRIGVAIGAIVAALFIAGFCIIFNGRRRRRAIIRQHQINTGYADLMSKHGSDGLGGHVPVAGEMMQSATSNTTGSGGFFDSPQSQRPLHPAHWGQIQGHSNVLVGPQIITSMEESPMSAAGEKPYFSPYSSHYSSPASAGTEGHGRGPNGVQWPSERKGSFGQGGGSMADKMRTRGARKEVESDPIEMQNVAPVFHPGHGRSESIGLTAEDARRGNAM